MVSSEGEAQLMLRLYDETAIGKELEGNQEP